MNLDPRIRSYLSGSMSPEERNRFEKEMQKDPFLADAVEGFSNVTPLEADHDLKTIRSKIFQGRTKKSFIMPSASSPVSEVRNGMIVFDKSVSAIIVVPPELGTD